MASLETLRKVTEHYDIFSLVEGRASLSIDNTGLDPAQVAARIINHYHLPTV